MFDVGWSEILVIVVVAVVVVGPKDLPRMLRTFGKAMGQVRRTANDFRRQFDEALREAEREAGLEETRQQLKAIARPVEEAKKSLGDSLRQASDSVKADALKPASSPAPQDDAAVPQPAEPAKTGALPPAHGSDAA
jgi:sec-independent protein translocase protein TatB